MSLIDEAKKIRVSETKRALIRNLVPNDEALELALAYLEGTVSNHQIAEVLNGKGYRIKQGNCRFILSNAVFTALKQKTHKLVALKK